MVVEKKDIDMIFQNQDKTNPDICDDCDKLQDECICCIILYGAKNELINYDHISRMGKKVKR